mmetsp:Transcript_25223/g.32905  ORF Transcript_25223/g.32905 Transcript_25223/m.32905 type:complete len:283 (-) Transcript_25223:653-1501(-)
MHRALIFHSFYLILVAVIFCSNSIRSGVAFFPSPSVANPLRVSLSRTSWQACSAQDAKFSLVGEGEEETATFAMGCFWCPEAIFGVAKGVISTKVGYSGGTTPSPTYQNMGDHTESVQLVFRPSEISYEELLEIFWANHSPILHSGKKQYQCFAFPHTDSQLQAALTSLEHQKSIHKKEIFTRVEKYSSFTDAEPHHQKRRLNNKVEIMEFLGVAKESSELKTSYLACRLNGYLGGYGNIEDFSDEVLRYGLSEKQVRVLVFAAKRHISQATKMKKIEAMRR